MLGGAADHIERRTCCDPLAFPEDCLRVADQLTGDKSGAEVGRETYVLMVSELCGESDSGRAARIAPFPRSSTPKVAG